MELYFPGFVKNHSQTSAFGCLESVAKGQFNNYATLKLSFLTQLVPPSRFVAFVHENSLALRHAQDKHTPFFKST